MTEMYNNCEVAIRLSGVKKRYVLGQIGGRTLQADIQSWWAKKRGKEDPNTKIDQDQRLVGKSFMALNGIDLTIYKGEAVGIIGHNGAGKSTMLKLLSRVTAPTEGEIDLYGRVASMLEVGTGFNGEMTGRENIYMNGAILGMTKAEIDSKMEQIIEFSEVRDFIDTPVKRYSSGMYVKLAFSVAAHLDNEIMIMDEVLAVGDVAFQNKCLKKMREAAKEEGRTVLYVSHNMNTIRRLCDRCIVLDSGKVSFDGDVEKGIIAYLGQQENDYAAHVSLERVEREKYVKGSVKMLELEYLNKKEAVFLRQEPIRLLLKWKALTNLEGVVFRMIIRNHLDSPVGVVLSEPLKAIKDGETTTSQFEFNPAYLVPGKYSFSLSMMQIDDAGNRVLLDHLYRATSIELQEDRSDGSSLKWDERSWGSVEFSKMKTTWQ